MNITILDNLPPLKLDILIFIQSMFTLFTVLKVIEIFILHTRKLTRKSNSTLIHKPTQLINIQKEVATRIVRPRLTSKVFGKISDDEEETSSSIGESRNSQSASHKKQGDFGPNTQRPKLRRIRSPSFDIDHLETVISEGVGLSVSSKTLIPKKYLVDSI